MENYLFQQISLQPILLPFNFYQFPPIETTEAFSSNTEPAKKPRGRRKIRPGNPLKTEVLDKYWLRAFRSFIRFSYEELMSLSSDTAFWEWYFTRGKPSSNGEHLSYNSHYKQKLFGNPSFCACFAAWGLSSIYYLKPKKSLRKSWEYYFDYFTQELIPLCFHQANTEDFARFQSFVYEKLTINNKN